MAWKLPIMATSSVRGVRVLDTIIEAKLEHARRDNKAKENCFFVAPHCGLIEWVLRGSMNIMDVDDFVLLRKDSHLSRRQKLLETEMFYPRPPSFKHPDPRL